VIVFVALDDQGAPAEIERWRPETEEDAALEQYAKSIMGLRKGIEEEETRLREAMLL
jgi:acyl-CoA hydrolase